MQFAQQVLLAVAHVQNDQLFQTFEFVQVPENYTYRFIKKTPEQLADEAAEQKIREDEERRAEEAANSPLNSLLSFFGLSSASTSSDGADGGASALVEEEEDDESSDDEEEMRHLHPLDPKKRGKKGLGDIDRRPLQLPVPVLAAFKHLTAVSAPRDMIYDVPENYGDSTSVYASFEHARPALKKQNQDFIYQSMVHKIKASGGPSRVRFEAAAFNLKEYTENKGKPQYKSDDYDFDDSSTDASGSQADPRDRSNGLPSMLLSASSTTLQKIVTKSQRSVTVMAKPAFVIKSRRTKDDKAKVFINVLHHPTFDDLVLSGVISIEPYEEPLTGLGDSFVTRDKSGGKAAVYNVLIASSYVKTSFRKYEKRITDPQFVKMVRTIHTVCIFLAVLFLFTTRTSAYGCFISKC